MRNDELLKLYDDINIIFGAKYKTDDLAVLAPIYRDYGFAEMRQALTMYAQDAKFYPKPADLIAIAKENRQEAAIRKYQEEMANVKYDSNGERIYRCPYCKDSNYMFVRTEEWCGGAPCLHTRESARKSLQTKGYFTFKLPWMKQFYKIRFDGFEMVQVDMPVKKVVAAPARKSYAGQPQVMFDFDLPF